MKKMYSIHEIRMKYYKKIIVLSSALLLILASAGRDSSDAVASTKQKGMSYAAWWSGLYSHPDSDKSLKNLAATGADWISLIVTCYQDNVGSTKIAPNISTPTDEDLIHVIRQAHSLGLKVMLKPHVDLWNDPSHWRGQIGNVFRTEAEWTAWFASYRNFINHYADLGQTHGADQFSAGCELSGTAHRAADWRRVVTEVRSRYRGPLVYAANHSGEETGITWWDAVDYIGVDTYFPLTQKKDATLAELKSGWEKHITTLSNLAVKWQKPIIITEIGYRSLDGAAMHPWNWQISGPIDLGEQADAYRAAFQSLYHRFWLAGIFWWSWSHDPLEGGPCDNGYTPYDKPAEDVLRSWYGAAPRPILPIPPEPDYSKTIDIYTDGLGPNWQDWSWNAQRNFFATDRVMNGVYSLSARLGAWGAVSFWHPPFPLTPEYYWLEFHIQASDGPQPVLWAYLYDDQGNELGRRRVDDCRYIEGGTIDAGVWKTVSIPLQDLNVRGRKLTRICLQDRLGRPSSGFWVDDIRIVSAKRRPGGRLHNDRSPW